MNRLGTGLAMLALVGCADIMGIEGGVLAPDLGAESDGGGDPAAPTCEESIPSEQMCSASDDRCTFVTDESASCADLCADFGWQCESANMVSGFSVVDGCGQGDLEPTQLDCTQERLGLLMRCRCAL